MVPVLDMSNCTTSCKGTLVVVQENKRRAAFRNPENSDYRVTRIDNCLVKDGVKVDYLVSKVGVASVLVELKGCDVDHACDQLEATVRHPSVDPLLEDRIGFVIVCRRYPKIDTKVQRAKTRIARDFKTILQVVCDRGEFDIERVAGRAR